jgi:hypothetical protein
MKLITLSLTMITGILFAHAVYFSEIMYDPQGSDSTREWIEIFNDTSTSIDFTSWKFFESGTNHGIVSFSGGTTVSPSGYAVIADNPVKFMTDYPSYSGVLYDSSFSLSNTGEQLILKDGTLTAVDTVTYNTALGGNDDGSSLSFISSLWTRGSATPGATNQESLAIVTTTATTTDNQTTVAQMSPPTPDIVFYMPAEKIVIAGADAELSTYGMTRAGKPIENLVYTWAFGDGGQGIGSSTLYRYAYPGRYVAQVEGTNGYVKSVGRIIVRVVPPDIAISNIGVGKYGNYIEITNPGGHDLDLSQWKILINGASFPFPKNTLILKNTTTRFPGVAMGFASTSIATSTEIKIVFPNQEEVTKYTYTNPEIKIETPKVVTIPPKKINYPTPRVLGTSTTTIGTTTPQIKSRGSKDTRIITWVKSFFR